MNPMHNGKTPPNPIIHRESFSSYIGDSGSIPVTQCRVSNGPDPDWAKRDGMKLLECRVRRDCATVYDPKTQRRVPTTVHYHTYLILPVTNEP